MQLHWGETRRELSCQQALGIRTVQPDPPVVPIRRADAEADENPGYRTGPAEGRGQARLAQEVEPEVVVDLVGDDEVLLAGEPEPVLSDRPDALGGVELLRYGPPDRMFLSGGPGASAVPTAASAACSSLSQPHQITRTDNWFQRWKAFCSDVNTDDLAQDAAVYAPGAAGRHVPMLGTPGSHRAPADASVEAGEPSPGHARGCRMHVPGRGVRR
ncbi:hypothetical protein [Streptomyces sp. NPDC056296]|uniref:hypothetical protein n=1 Tax=Streptomyces sp. NPDC056296 TaxID=3345775 RepID=UPI0035D743CB